MTRPSIIHPGCAAALLLASLLGCGDGTLEGKTFSDRLREAGITNVYAGENIALNYSAEGAVTAWINSSGHYQNMTTSRFRKIGVGVYSTQIESQGHVYYVQVFTS